MLFETHSGPYEVKVLFEGDDRPCMLSIRFVPGDVIMSEGEFRNARMLSAQLRDTLGLGPAIEVLGHWCISPNSDLWDLNHSNPHTRLEVMARDDEYFEPEYCPDEGYRLLDRTGWSDYEGGGRYYLYERIIDSTLWMGESTSPGCGNEPYDNEIEPIAYGKWLQSSIVVMHWLKGE